MIPIIRMINYLCKYKQLWNLKINMDKSKIFNFRNEGRIAKREMWFYQNEIIDIIVNEV